MAFQYSECEFQETLETGNMIACIKYLKKLRSVCKLESILCTSLFASTIGDMVQRFVRGTHIPVEYAEAILESVEKLIGASNNPTIWGNFAENDAFITSTFKIVADYRTLLFKESPNYHELSSYSSHRCYETVLFLLVGLIDSSKILVLYIKALKVKRTLELVKHLGHVILVDKSYVTQELALDIICRIYHYYSKINSTALPDILKGLPSIISKACSDPNVGTSKILRNMRPLLLDINKSNQNINSLSLKSFYIQKKLSDHNEDDRYVTVDKWLDIEFERFSFSVMGEDSVSYSLVKTSYHTIRQMHFDVQTLTMKIFLGFCSENLAKILTMEELKSPEGFSPYLCFTFHDEKTLSEAKRLLEHQMSLRELVKHSHSSGTCVKMSVASTRSASMVDAKMIAKISDMKDGVETERIFQPLFGSELEADQGVDLHEKEVQLQPEPVKEVVAQDPSVAATTSAPQDSPSSISSPDMNFGSLEDAIAPEATMSDKQTITTRNRPALSNKVAAPSKPSNAKSVPMSLSYSLRQSRKGTASRANKKGLDAVDEKENLPRNVTAAPNKQDDFVKEKSVVDVIFTPKKQPLSALSTVPSAIESTPVHISAQLQKRQREFSAVAETKSSANAIFPHPGTATAAKKKMLAATKASEEAAAAAKERRISEEVDAVRLTQDTARTAAKKPLARMRFTPCKPIEKAEHPSKGIPPAPYSPPPLSPSMASVHTNNTTSSKRKYGKVAAGVSNATAKLLSIQDTATIFNFDNTGNNLHNKRQKSMPSTSSNAVADKASKKKPTLPGRDVKGVYKTPTTANLQKHNAFVSSSNLIFQPIQGLQDDSGSEHLSQKKRKLSQSPKKVKQQLVHAQVREPSPPADYEQLTQPQGPEEACHGDHLDNGETYARVDAFEETQEYGFDISPTVVPVPIAVVSKQIKETTPVLQKPPELEKSKSPEPPQSSKPPAAARMKAGRPTTVVVKPAKRQLLKKLLSTETAPATTTTASAEKSKYFSDPFAGSRESVLPLKLQAASSAAVVPVTSSSAAANALSEANEKEQILKPKFASFMQAPKSRSAKHSIDEPYDHLQPPTAAMTNYDDGYVMDNDDFKPPTTTVAVAAAATAISANTTSVVQAAKPLFTPPATFHRNQQSKLTTSGLTTAATASTSLLTNASAQSASQDIAAVQPAPATTAVWRCHLQPKQSTLAAETDSAAPLKGSLVAAPVATSHTAASKIFSLSVSDGGRLCEGVGAGQAIAKRGVKKRSSKRCEERSPSQDTTSDVENNAVVNRRHAADSDDDDEDEDVEREEEDNSDFVSDAGSDASYRMGLQQARPSKAAANKGYSRSKFHPKSQSRGRGSAPGKLLAVRGYENEFDASQRSSDDDQEIVLQMLIQELLKFKEEREQRRRESAVKRVVAHASTAMEAFLRQATECADSSCAESKAQAIAKLQALSTSAEEIFTAIVSSSESLWKQSVSIRERQERLALETAALIAEASAASAQCRSEETTLRNELLAKKQLARGAVSQLRGHAVLSKASANRPPVPVLAESSKRKRPSDQVRSASHHPQLQEKATKEDLQGYGGVSKAKRQKYQQEILEAMHQT